MNTSVKDSSNLIIPLNFWFFCRYSGLNLPLIAMPYVDIYLKFHISDINNLVRKDAGTVVNLGNNLDMKLISNYIYLDENERKTFAEARHEYLIEQIQFNGDEGLNENSHKFDIYFRNNLKDLYWIVRDNQHNLYEKDRGNYSLGNDDNSENPIDKTTIYINNVKFVEFDGTYSNYVVPYERYISTPSDGVNVYSFNLTNYDYQPSGSLNFSMLDKVQM